MDLGLKDKVAIVTGGSRGIGKSIALTLAAEGCNVAICARGEEGLREAGAELKGAGIKVHAGVVDVSQPGEVEAFVDEVVATLGRVDVLVNNAGGSRPGDDDETWRAAIDVNLMSAVRASRAAVEHMKASGGGSIINITSIFGRESGGSPTYNAAKAAMTSHAKQLALQLAPMGIRVNSVAPGSIEFPGGSWAVVCSRTLRAWLPSSNKTFRRAASVPSRRSPMPWFSFAHQRQAGSPARPSTSTAASRARISRAR